MNIEQLMQPRYEVIADYPEQKDSVGFIYEGNGWSKFWWDEMERCPAIFRKLQWWEHRKPEEMPEYVKCLFNCEVIDTLFTKDAIYKLSEIKLDPLGYSFFTPSTAEEYNTQQNKK